MSTETAPKTAAPESPSPAPEVGLREVLNLVWWHIGQLLSQPDPRQAHVLMYVCAPTDVRPAEHFCARRLARRVCIQDEAPDRSDTQIAIISDPEDFRMYIEELIGDWQYDEDPAHRLILAAAAPVWVGGIHLSPGAWPVRWDMTTDPDQIIGEPPDDQDLRNDLPRILIMREGLAGWQRAVIHYISQLGTRGLEFISAGREWGQVSRQGLTLRCEAAVRPAGSLDLSEVHLETISLKIPAKLWAWRQ